MASMPWTYSDAARAEMEQRAFPPSRVDQLMQAADPFEDDALRIQAADGFERLPHVNQFSYFLRPTERDRLTHTLDVYQVAARIGQQLGFGPRNFHLMRAVVYAHDIGHPPFAHEGEEALRHKLESYGLVYDHDNNAIRHLCEWENRSPLYPGLNPTAATIEGVEKRYRRHRMQERPIMPGSAEEQEAASHYSRPEMDDAGQLQENHFIRELTQMPLIIWRLSDQLVADDHMGLTQLALHLGKQNHIEGQVAAIADWTAFMTSDILDGLRLSQDAPPGRAVLTMEEIQEHFPLARELLPVVEEEFGPEVVLNPDRPAMLLFSQLIRARLIDDIVEETRRKVKMESQAGNLRYAEDVRDLPELLVTFSPEMERQVLGLQTFFYDVVFERMERESRIYQKMVGESFELLMAGEIHMDAHAGYREKERLVRQAAERDPQAEKALAALTAEYITVVMTNQDVLDVMQQYRPRLFEEYARGGQCDPERWPGLGNGGR